jgi:hypothetical protein
MIFVYNWVGEGDLELIDGLDFGIKLMLFVKDLVLKMVS